MDSDSLVHAVAVFGIMLVVGIWSARRERRAGAGRESAAKTQRDYGGRFLFTAAATLIVAGLMVLALQFYHYLQHGAWTSLSVIDVLAWFGDRRAATPEDWPALYQVLDWTPIAAVLIAAGIGLAATGR